MSKEINTYTSPTINDCDFCPIPEIKTTAIFADMHDNLQQSLAIPNMPDDYTILQDVVPVAENGGHLLLMPNKHYLSLATIENQKELEKATDAVMNPLREEFPNNPIMIFEHGPGFVDDEPIACGGCHMDHAHGHMLLLPERQAIKPIQDKMEHVLLNKGWEDMDKQRNPSDKVFTNIAETSGINPYLHVGMIDTDGNKNSLTYVQKKLSQQVPLNY